MTSTSIRTRASGTIGVNVLKKMRFAPIELADFISMVVAGLIPALPLLLTVVPPSVIGKILLKLVTVAA